MPLYEYECENCGHRFEAIQKFSDAPLTECPKCKGTVRKLFSSPAIQFKGSGWYITDYARKNTAGAGGTTKTESSSSGDSSGSSTSDSKPAKTDAPAPAKPAGGS